MGIYIYRDDRGEIFSERGKIGLRKNRKIIIPVIFDEIVPVVTSFGENEKLYNLFVVRVNESYGLCSRYVRENERINKKLCKINRLGICDAGFDVNIVENIFLSFSKITYESKVGIFLLYIGDRLGAYNPSNGCVIPSIYHSLYFAPKSKKYYVADGAIMEFGNSVVFHNEEEYQFLGAYEDFYYIYKARWNVLLCSP